jgi:tRNA splicing ligase
MTDINIAIREFDQGTDHSVIEQLYKVKEESPKLLRSKDFSLENEVTWTSWTMQEHVYKKNPSAFPTQARGLFTRKVDDKYTVAVRGYDKFFNLFETQDTQVKSR